MTTPKIPRPGQVQLPAAWVSSSLPCGPSLPDWFPRDQFLPQLAELLEAYRERQTAASLSTMVQQQNQVAVPWLRAAQRELRRGELARLRHSPAKPMPGAAHPACWYEAHKRGLDWDGLIAAASEDRGRMSLISEVVGSAIASLEKGRRPRLAGRKPLQSRDQILRGLVTTLRQYERPEWQDGTPRRRLTLAEALALADGILVACRIESPENPKAAARAARRGAPRRG